MQTEVIVTHNMTAIHEPKRHLGRTSILRRKREVTNGTTDELPEIEVRFTRIWHREIRHNEVNQLLNKLIGLEMCICVQKKGDLGCTYLKKGRGTDTVLGELVVS